MSYTTWQGRSKGGGAMGARASGANILGAPTKYRIIIYNNKK